MLYKPDPIQGPSTGMITPHVPRIRIYHNGLWAKYKGAIFSRIFSHSGQFGVSTTFVQVCETNKQRALLADVDLTYHQYPYKLLFRGFSDAIPGYKLLIKLLTDVLRNQNELVVIPGYHRLEYWAMLIACILLRRKRAVFVDSTAYDQAKTPLKEAAKAFFFRRCDAFFCYGTRSKEYVASYGINERRIFYGCQAAALPQAYDAAAIRDHYVSGSRKEAAAPRFLYVGRLSREKGLFDLLNAFLHVRSQLPEAKLGIVGSGLLERELRDRTQQFGLDSAVSFLGTKSLEDIGQLLMNSVAMILPSHVEPWGLVVNEALSYGCPVVVSNICGCVPELVRDGETGYSFPVGDTHAMCQAMVAAARLSKDRLAVAMKCMSLIEQYTPDRAALEILKGCVNVIKIPQ